MPFLSKYQDPLFECLIWKIDESAPYFIHKLGMNAAAQKQLQLKFKHEGSKIQWLAARHSLELLFDRSYHDFVKDKKGKSSLVGHSLELSISHCSRYTCVIKSRLKVGIDIQQQTTKLSKIASKYIDSQTLRRLQLSEHIDAYLHFYWGIKEALFKAYGKGQLNFIEHLHIDEFNYSPKGKTNAQIIKANRSIDYDVFFEQKEDFYLCIVIQKNPTIIK